MEDNIWHPLALGFIKLNFDGSSDSRIQRSAVGVIARDDHGIVQGLCSCSMPFCSPLIAEVWAVWHGFRWACEAGQKHISIETDSLLAANFLNQSKDWKGNFKSLFWRIANMISEFHTTDIHFSPRQANQCANWLARQGLFRNFNSNFQSCISSSLSHFLYLDSLNFPYSNDKLLSITQTRVQPS